MDTLRVTLQPYKKFYKKVTIKVFDRKEISDGNIVNSLKTNTTHHILKPIHIPVFA